MKSFINPSDIQLENIYIAMSRLTFSKDVAAKIVGGEGKLLRLIASGEVQAEKGCNSQNSKWKCNAAQVLRNCRNFRE